MSSCREKKGALHALQPPIQTVPEGTYVRVYGNFRGASADNPGALGPITAFVVRPVQDHNEVRTCRRLVSRALRGDSELV